MEPQPYFMRTRDLGLHLLADAAQLLAGKFDLKAKMFHTLEEAIVALGLAHRRSESWNRRVSRVGFRSFVR
jgi:hypothetical protein